MSQKRVMIESLKTLLFSIALLAWVIWLRGGIEAYGRDLRRFGPILAIEGCFFLGMTWSIARVYLKPPDRQTPSIVGLISSLLGLIFAPLAYFGSFGW